MNERCDALLALLVLAGSSCRTNEANPLPAAPRSENSRSITPRNAVVAGHTRASTEAGIRVLEEGGNAIDAFVAATFVEFVVIPGAVTITGNVGALVHRADPNSTEYLEGEFQHARDPAGLWTDAESPLGTTYTPAGAVRGLEELAERHGTRPFSELIEPSRRIAHDGFVIDETFAATIAWRADVLRRSEYGLRTFFRSDGTPLLAGDVLTQPELAGLLGELQRRGADHVYEGEWARRAVEAANANGGRLTAADLAQYATTWNEPYVVQYRGRELRASAGAAIGGVTTLLALRALERTELDTSLPFTASAHALETLVRVLDATFEEPWLFEPTTVFDRARVEAHLEGDAADRIWSRVHDRVQARRHPTGSHSSAILAVDRQGNAVVGSHSMGALPWGEGIFVDGAALNAAAPFSSNPTPGERMIGYYTETMVFEDGQLRAAQGTFAGGMFEAAVQDMVHLIDYRLDPAVAATRPRFGTAAYDLASPGARAPQGRFLDPRVSATVVQELQARGLRMVQEFSFVDTGAGVLMSMSDDGTVQAATLSLAGTPEPYGFVEVR